jgi:hypothetical protein
MQAQGAVLLPGRARRPEQGPQREHAVGPKAHPETLRLPQWRHGPLLLIDDPFTRALGAGDATVGWAGDERLALYASPATSQWVLVRLEYDGVYRIERVTTLVAGVRSSIDVFAELLRDLTATDTRRGWNPLEAAQAHNEARDDAMTAEFEDWLREDGAPRLVSEFKRGLGAHF